MRPIIEGGRIISYQGEHRFRFSLPLELAAQDIGRMWLIIHHETRVKRTLSTPERLRTTLIVEFNSMIPSAQNFTVSDSQTGLRLDNALATFLSMSRSQAQQLIERGHITINEHLPKKAGDRLRLGDIITYQEKFTAHGVPHTVLEPSIPDKNVMAGYKLTIIAQTPNFIVVNKPSGLLTHPTQAGEEVTLTSLLTAHFPELRTIGESLDRPGIVHRLDKEASGLLVVARTPAMFAALKQQFKERRVGKHYTVLVHDPLPRLEGTIDFPIERSENAERMAALPKTERGLVTDKGKEALTDFLVLKNYVNFSLLDVTIHTGRMHQIRAHMFAYNHPVVGDPLYIQKKRPRTWDERCGRLFLHCSRLSFTDLDGLPQEFESELPDTLKNFLTTLA